MAMRDRDLMMFLVCIFSMSLFASCLEFSRAKPPYFDRQKSSEEDSQVSTAPEDLGNEGGSSEEEETYKRARRSVRKYPEEAEDVEYRHHQHMEMEHHAALRNHDCDCPDMLAKGTLIAIVAASAFLFIFSSSIQLVVTICILRLVKKQRKMEKEGKAHSHSSHHRKHHPHPPAPPPRPENTYMTMKAHGYERLHLASVRAKQGVYLSATELHPGPRFSQEKRYQNVGGSPQVATFSQEKRYQNVGGSPQVATSTPEKEYIVTQATLFSPINEGSPEAVASPKKRETHLYEEVE